VRHFHFTIPPADQPWAKAVAQLNREFLLNHAADERIFGASKDPESDKEWRELGFKKAGKSWVFKSVPDKGLQGKQREGKTKAKKAVNKRKAKTK
jgi:hypothetical protein